MNRKIAVFIVGLLALGALEFGLLGASASGLVGGSGGHALPPLAERGIVQATPTPVATATASGTGIRPIIIPTEASIEMFTPDPAAIACDGAHASTVRVFVRDYRGQAVPDGTYVHFLVVNGSPSPYDAQTIGGSASTSVVIYSEAYSLLPNVLVGSGDLEMAIRVRCIPNSGCPLSPPPNASPPCVAPTPFPCNPSPGADINSPPCAIETPISPSDGIATCIDFTQPDGCIPSPPSPPICAPNQTSPPCATPTPIPECAPYVPSSPPCVPPSPPRCDPNAPSPPCGNSPTATRTRAATGTPGVRRTATPEYEVCADVNGDGRVTPRDVSAIAAHIIGRYQTKFDLNHDGRVNMEDVKIAIRQLGRRC